jgi:hypothetical protein
MDEPPGEPGNNDSAAGGGGAAAGVMAAARGISDFRLSPPVQASQKDRRGIGRSWAAGTIEMIERQQVIRR